MNRNTVQCIIFSKHTVQVPTFRNTQMNLTSTILVLLPGGNSWALLHHLVLMQPSGWKSLNFLQHKVQLKGTLQHKPFVRLWMHVRT